MKLPQYVSDPREVSKSPADPPIRMSKWAKEFLKWRAKAGKSDMPPVLALGERDLMLVPLMSGWPVRWLADAEPMYGGMARTGPRPEFRASRSIIRDMKVAPIFYLEWEPLNVALQMPMPQGHQVVVREAMTGDGWFTTPGRRLTALSRGFTDEVSAWFYSHRENLVFEFGFVTKGGQGNINLSAAHCKAFPWRQPERKKPQSTTVDFDSVQGTYMIGRFLQTRVPAVRKLDTSNSPVGMDPKDRVKARSVSVVSLRYEDTEASDSRDGSEIDHAYRWWVRGHWRNQFYPSDGSHRMIWVDRHSKGPDDKPFKEQVFRVCR